MWTGDVIAERFVIERPAGSGGMGSVFLALDRADGRRVAIKAMSAPSEDATERFRREARVLSELSHPAIVRYLAHGETGIHGEPFLVMEWLDGEDLGDRLSRTGLTPGESIDLIRRAAEALAFAHERGVIHRDIKPSNIFLVGGAANRVKVLDFGAARRRNASQVLTQAGMMLGTLGYMAPEQAWGSPDVDARADVFALGCVLFECLTGRPAFVGHRAVAILAKIVSDEVPRVSELCPHISADLDELVAILLSKDPKARPADGNAVLALLDQLGKIQRGNALPAVARPPCLSDAERRVVSVVLAENPNAQASSVETVA
jgi:serine/threonine protein kinase